MTFDIKTPLVTGTAVMMTPVATDDGGTGSMGDLFSKALTIVVIATATAVGNWISSYIETRKRKRRATQQVAAPPPPNEEEIMKRLLERFEQLKKGEDK